MCRTPLYRTLNELEHLIKRQTNSNLFIYCWLNSNTLFLASKKRTSNLTGSIPLFSNYSSNTVKHYFFEHQTGTCLCFGNRTQTEGGSTLLNNCCKYLLSNFLFIKQEVVKDWDCHLMNSVSRKNGLGFQNEMCVLKS